MALHVKISYKLISAVGAAASVIIGVFAYVLLTTYHDQVVDDIEQYAHQLSETVKSSTRHDMLLNQRESVHQIISTIGTQEGIDKVRIYNKDGEIILSTEEADIGHMVDMNAEACFACHTADQPLESLPISERTRVFNVDQEHRMLGIINPIYNEPTCWQSDCHAHQESQKVLGVLDITMSLAEVDRKTRESGLQLIGLSILVIVVISLIIYWLAERIVLRRVERVVEATERVAAGELSHRIVDTTNDEIGTLASSFNDMTEKLALVQNQLFQSDKLASVGRLAAGVAHEINNPLTGVLTYSSFLLSRADDPEVQADLEVVVRETKRCREIVRSLLDFSRQSAPQKRKVDVNEIVHHAVSITQNQLTLNRIHLELNLRGDVPPVQADLNQLQQVLVNLLVNAADSIPRGGGTIVVETDESAGPVNGNGHNGAAGRYVRITVRDTGCGISAENMSKIYDPFFTTKGQRGTGLGLAIVWGITEEHGGKITVDSRVGEGTAFTVWLPAPDAAGSPNEVRIAAESGVTAD